MLVTGKQHFLTYGTDLHIGKGTLLWAPVRMTIGHHVYIGKHVHIEANCEMGDYCLLANNVAILGRHDHDFTAVGYPVRYAPWIASKRIPSRYIDEKVVICNDVWLGYGVIVLTGVTIGRGAIVAAGSVVTHSIQPYTIVAGVPAKPVGQRFTSRMDVETHEAAIERGNFSFSERSYDHCRIEPGLQKMNLDSKLADDRHDGTPKKKVVFAFDRVMHYHKATIAAIERDMQDLGYEFILLSSQDKSTAKGRVAYGGKVAQHHEFFELIDTKIGSFAVRYQLGLLRLIRKIKPDIVVSLCHSGTLSEWQLASLKKGLGFKLIAWQCGYEFNPGKLKQWILSKFVLKFDHHLAYHTNAMHYALAHGARPDQITVMHNTINEAAIK